VQNIPENYPRDCSDEAIIKVINFYASNISKAGNTSPSITGWSSIIQLGQNELQHRSIKEQMDIIKDSSDSSSLLGRRALYISIFSFVLSFLAISISIYIATLSIKSSQRWEDKQIKLISEINEKLVK